METETARTILLTMCGLGLVTAVGALALDVVEVIRLRPQAPTLPLGDLISPRRLLGKRLAVAGLWWLAFWLAMTAVWLALQGDGWWPQR